MRLSTTENTMPCVPLSPTRLCHPTIERAVPIASTTTQASGMLLIFTPIVSPATAPEMLVDVWESKYNIKDSTSA